MSHVKQINLATKESSYSRFYLIRSKVFLRVQDLVFSDVCQ